MRQSLALHDRAGRTSALTIRPASSFARDIHSLTTGTQAQHQLHRSERVDVFGASHLPTLLPCARKLAPDQPKDHGRASNIYEQREPTVTVRYFDWRQVQAYRKEYASK
jgi:hypothetical protein